MGRSPINEELSINCLITIGGILIYRHYSTIYLYQPAAGNFGRLNLPLGGWNVLEPILWHVLGVASGNLLHLAMDQYA